MSRQISCWKQGHLLWKSEIVYNYTKSQFFVISAARAGSKSAGSLKQECPDPLYYVMISTLSFYLFIIKPYSGFLWYNIVHVTNVT